MWKRSVTDRPQELKQVLGDSKVDSNGESLFKAFSRDFRIVIADSRDSYYGGHVLDEGVTNFVIVNLEGCLDSMERWNGMVEWWILGCIELFHVTSHVQIMTCHKKRPFWCTLLYQ